MGHLHLVIGLFGHLVMRSWVIVHWSFRYVNLFGHCVIWSCSHEVIQSFTHLVIWSSVIWSFGHLFIGHLVIWAFGHCPVAPGQRGNGATGNGATRQRGNGATGQSFAAAGRDPAKRSTLLKKRVRTPSGDPVGHPFGEKILNEKTVFKKNKHFQIFRSGLKRTKFQLFLF